MDEINTETLVLRRCHFCFVADNDGIDGFAESPPGDTGIKDFSLSERLTNIEEIIFNKPHSPSALKCCVQSENILVRVVHSSEDREICGNTNFMSWITVHDFCNIFIRYAILASANRICNPTDCFLFSTSVQKLEDIAEDSRCISLGKKVVNEMLKTAPPELADALVLRQQLAKSSVKKYQAMQNAVCSDGRARGMFQFYGANRTGRWAGRLIQMQNLPQNHLSDLAEARGLVRSGNYEAVKMLYEDVPDTLSQLIRTAFIPREGAMF